jgi:hypothetical protein
MDEDIKDGQTVEGEVVKDEVVEGEVVKDEVVEGEEKGEKEGEKEEPVKKGARGKPDARRALQRVNRELENNRAEMNRMRGALETMQNVAQSQGQRQASTEPDISSLSPDALHELWADDPIKYNKLVESQSYQKIRRAIQSDLNQQAQENSNETEKRQEEAELRDFIKSTKGHGGEVSDFNELYESGEIQEYMEENPSADYQLAWERLTFDQRVADKISTELKSRQKAQAGKGKVPMSSGSGGKQPLGAGKDPRVQNPKKYGMTPEDIMATRLREYRESQG